MSCPPLRVDLLAAARSRTPVWHPPSADAVLGVVAACVEQRLAALDDGAGAGGYYDPEEQAGARMELREWLGVLGVAPAIPEAPDPLTGLSITFVPAEGPPMPGGIGASSSLTHEPPEYPDAPDPAEMLRELQDAVVGYRYASPNPPATEWRLLLAAVATHCAPHRNAASLPTHEQEQADA